jgi:hypothetical protein
MDYKIKFSDCIINLNFHNIYILAKIKTIKKIISLLLLSIVAFVTAQETPPNFKNSSITSSGLKINSKKDILTEKQIVNLSKFKNLNIQKITLKDLSDNSLETSLGLMMEYETFDRISKKTLTVEKKELSKLIQSLQTLEQKENENIGNSEKKYKFVLLNNIEFGAVYKENLKNWVNYIKFPTEYYSQSIYEFSKDELKELIKLLKTADKEL